MAAVGDLLAAVRESGRAEKRLLRDGTSDGLSVGEERRPVRRARSVAGAAPVLVLLEQVERVALAVDEDAAQLRARDADPGPAGGTVGARHCSRAVGAGRIR